jgi:hypothetical protein
MGPGKSRDHRLRVLENQARVAAERQATAELGAERQMTMPLIVEVKTSPATQRARRSRKRRKAEQPLLGDM